MFRTIDISISIELKRQFHTDGHKCFNSIEKKALVVGGGVMEWGLVRIG